MGLTHLLLGFDGTMAHNEGKNKTQVLLKETKQHWMHKPSCVFEQKGLDDNDVHAIALQTEMDKQKRQDITDMGEDPNSHHRLIIKTRVIFELKVKVTLFFCNEFGNKMSNASADGDKAKWAFFWMMDCGKVPKPKPKLTKLVCNCNCCCSKNPCTHNKNQMPQ